MKQLLLLFACWTTVVAGRAGQQPMRLWYAKPANYFEESLPLGNGRMGALVYGNPQDDIVQLNDITLWTGQPVDRQEDAGASRWIPKIREALFAENYALADSLQLHVQGHNSSHYQPLGTLRLQGPAGHVTDYRRELSLDSAMARVTYRQGAVAFCREYLCSAPDSLVALHLTASKPGQISTVLSLASLLPHQVSTRSGQLTMTGHATGDEAQTIHFCTIVSVSHRGGTLTATDSTLVLDQADEATVWVTNATSFNGFDRHPVSQAAPWLQTAARLARRAQGASYASVRSRHVADHRQFFSRVGLNLHPHDDGTPFLLPTDSLLKTYNTGHPQNDRYLETLYFQYGRYLLIGCSRTPAVPANLQGLWNPHLWAPWRSNYTININLEENYWPVFNCNLAEMALPLDGFLQALAENGRYTSANYFGIGRGWSACHNSDIWAMTNPVGEKKEKHEWANWPMGGAWLVESLWEKYLFTCDDDYLRRVAYPLLKGAALFCLDWLVPNPHNPAELITAPSTSPENEYVTDGGYHGMTCYGGTADLAIVRELLTNTLLAARIVGDDDEVCQAMAAALPRLHPYTIGREGDLNEWYYDWRDYDPHHRHQSHLIGLYPGHHVSNGELKRACEQTLIQKGDQTTGWSTGWRINLWARLHKGDEAYHIYQKLLGYVSPDKYKGADRRRPGGGTYPNLFDAHPPFQIDGNFGGTAGVCEMLLQSSLDPVGSEARIELLPALPAAWPSGEVSGLCARGGYEIDMQWRDGRVTSVAIKAKKSGSVTLSYNGTAKTLRLKAGQQKRLKFS